MIFLRRKTDWKHKREIINLLLINHSQTKLLVVDLSGAGVIVSTENYAKKTNKVIAFYRKDAQFIWVEFTGWRKQNM